MEKQLVEQQISGSANFFANLSKVKGFEDSLAEDFQLRLPFSFQGSNIGSSPALWNEESLQKSYEKINQKIMLFKQNMFYYKFNLKLPNLVWSGTKGCKKKYLKSPQWLRNIKDKKYPFYRIDTYFSEKKYINLQIRKEYF